MRKPLTRPPAPSADPDFSDYNGLLRNGILEAFSGIIQGLGQAKADHYLKSQVPDIVTFVASIGAEAEYDDDAAKAAVNLLGDICSVFLVRARMGLGSIYQGYMSMNPSPLSQRQNSRMMQLHI